MLIVAVAWIYVVGLMSLTQPTILIGVMTFLFYCVLPLSILFYLTGHKGRQRRAEAARQAAARPPAATSAAMADSGSGAEAFLPFLADTGDSNAGTPADTSTSDCASSSSSDSGSSGSSGGSGGGDCGGGGGGD